MPNLPVVVCFQAIASRHGVTNHEKRNLMIIKYNARSPAEDLAGKLTNQLDYDRAYA